MDKKTKILISVLAILVIALLFFFVAQPAYNSFVETKMLNGIELYIFNFMIPSLQEKGYVEIVIGNESLILVPYVPESA